MTLGFSEPVAEATISLGGNPILDHCLNLPAGQAQIIAQTMPELPKGDPFWDMMASIWAGQKARGHVPRSTEEVESSHQEMQEDWEERQLAIQKLQEESWRLREQMSC